MTLHQKTESPMIASCYSFHEFPVGILGIMGDTCHETRVLDEMRDLKERLLGEC